MGAVDQLNRKQKNFMDLISNTPFKWADIVTIQDPDKQDGRLVENFYYIQEKQQDDVVKHITNKEALTAAHIAEKQEKIRVNSSIQRIYDEKARLKEEKEKD